MNTDLHSMKWGKKIPKQMHEQKLQYKLVNKQQEKHSLQLDWKLEILTCASSPLFFF